MKTLSRLLLGFAALVLAIGSLMHASAFKRVTAAIADSNLVPFAANSLKVLWLQDSAICFILAIVFGVVAVRPSAATRSTIVLLAFIPAATAILIYTFIGSFIGGHIMLLAAVAGFIGGLVK